MSGDELLQLLQREHVTRGSPARLLHNLQGRCHLVDHLGVRIGFALAVYAPDQTDAYHYVHGKLHPYLRRGAASDVAYLAAPFGYYRLDFAGNCRPARVVAGKREYVWPVRHIRPRTPTSQPILRRTYPLPRGASTDLGLGTAPLACEVCGGHTHVVFQGRPIHVACWLK